MKNRIVSFAVLCCDKVNDEAINYVMNNNNKHFSAFEMPILIDLKKERIYFLNQTPLWGAIYFKHFKEYILKNYKI